MAESGRSSLSPDFSPNVGGTRAKPWPNGVAKGAGGSVVTTCADSAIRKAGLLIIRLSDWIEDARDGAPYHTGKFSGRASPEFTLVGNSLGSWIAWLVAQEFPTVDELILVAPAFNMMGERAKQISDERRHAWHTTGWMPWDDDALHKDWLLSWKWVEESEQYWAQTFSSLRRVKTTILHGLQDTVIPPAR